MTDWKTLFGKMKPGFFETEHIRSIPEDTVFAEMAMAPAGYDESRYVHAFGPEVTFGVYEGDRKELMEIVEQVNPGWVPLFGDEDIVYCGFVNGRVVSFCIVEEMGTHEVDGKVLRVGGPGCVGTLPEYRNRGIGLTMVSKVTAIFRDKGYDVSYIHYTGVADWYAKLGYETVLKWNGKGFVD